MSEGSQDASESLKRAQHVARRLDEIAGLLDDPRLGESREGEPEGGPTGGAGASGEAGPSGTTGEERVAELAREAAELVREGEEAIEAAARSAESREQ